jgi:hypothetical protein
LTNADRLMRSDETPPRCDRASITRAPDLRRRSGASTPAVHDR